MLISKGPQASALAVILGILTLLPGCSHKSEVAKLEADNIALVQRIHAEVSRGNLAIFDEVLSPDYARHCQAMPPQYQELRGVTQFKAFINDFIDAVPDCNDEIEFILADSNMVAYVTTTTGTQTGPIGNLAASGKPFSLTNIVIQRIEDGKIAETWISWDNVALLSQLGHFPRQTADETDGHR